MCLYWLRRKSNLQYTQRGRRWETWSCSNVSGISKAYFGHPVIFLTAVNPRPSLCPWRLPNLCTAAPSTLRALPWAEQDTQVALSCSSHLHRSTRLSQRFLTETSLGVPVLLPGVFGFASVFIERQSANSLGMYGVLRKRLDQLLVWLACWLLCPRRLFRISDKAYLVLVCPVWSWVLSWFHIVRLSSAISTVVMPISRPMTEQWKRQYLQT